MYGELANLGDDASYMLMASRPFAKGMNEDGFDPAIYAWQYNRSIEGAPGKYFRSSGANRGDFLLDTDQEAGWYKWNNYVERYDALLATESIDEEQHSMLKKATAEELGAKYPGWYEQYKDVGGSRYIASSNALDMILSNDEYRAKHGETPYYQSLQYLQEYRNKLIDLLQDRKADGGSSSLQAKSNADIALVYQEIVLILSDADPTGEFGRMHSRFFGSDPLQPIPGKR
jgi:hypothetical protein